MNANLLLSMLVVVLLAAESGAILVNGEHIAAGVLGLTVAAFLALVILAGTEKQKARR